MENEKKELEIRLGDCMDHLRRQFPNCHIVLIVRSPADKAGGANYSMTSNFNDSLSFLATYLKEVQKSGFDNVKKVLNKAFNA